LTAVILSLRAIPEGKARQSLSFYMEYHGDCHVASLLAMT
jgi:hypothetical protein